MALASSAINQDKFELHFAKLMDVLNELAKLPELAKTIPSLAEQLSLMNKKPPKASIKLVASLLPELLQKLVPLMPNIQVECDLTEQIRLKGLFERLMTIDDKQPASARALPIRKPLPSPYFFTTTTMASP